MIAKYLVNRLLFLGVRISLIDGNAIWGHSHNAIRPTRLSSTPGILMNIKAITTVSEPGKMSPQSTGKELAIKEDGCYAPPSF